MATERATGLRDALAQATKRGINGRLKRDKGPRQRTGTGGGAGNCRRDCCQSLSVGLNVLSIQR